MTPHASKSHTGDRPASGLLERYGIYASLLILAVLVSCGLVYLKLDERNQTNADALLSGHQTLESIRKARTSLREYDFALSAYLFQPDSVLADNVTVSLDTMLLVLRELADARWIKGNPDAVQLVDEIGLTIVQLAPLTIELMAIRRDRERLFPAMFTIVNQMYPANTGFDDAVRLAVDELREMPDTTDNREVRDLFQAAELEWTKMISSFRVFIAFRTGTFGTPEVGMPIYSHDVELQHEALLAVLARIRRLSEQRDIGLQPEASMESMIDAALDWFRGYEEVRLIQSSDHWRQDIPILHHQIRPLYLQLQAGLDRIDKAVDTSYQAEVLTNESVSRETNYVLWLLGALVIVFVLLGYVSLRRSLLLPVRLMTRSMLSEVEYERPLKLPRIRTREMYELVTAYQKMRQAVKSREAELEFQANHDALTMLPNRTSYRNRLQRLIKEQQQTETPIALVIIDLDRFKEINDTLGHPTGDQVLRLLAERLSETFARADNLFRLGGDEFGLLLERHNRVRSIEFANDVHKLLGQVIHLGEHSLRLSASIGIAIYPEHGVDADSLIAHADVAMYQAKAQQTMTAVYERSLDPNSEQRLHEINALREALDRDGLDLHYQPQIHMRTGEIHGFEALLRCPFSSLSTLEVVHLAETTGLIHPLTEWVISTALSNCREWCETDGDIAVAVNLSGVCFRNQDLEEQLYRQLQAWSLSPEHLKLEITESTMMHDPAGAAEILSGIAHTGVGVAVDDFGTGFSSLSYLKNLPVNELKIDRSFVKQMHESAQDKAIVQSVIELAHNLGMQVVAEGVETAKSWELLNRMGCDYAQGYYIARPLPGDEVLSWLRTGGWNASGSGRHGAERLRNI